MSRLQNGQFFPVIDLPAFGGGRLNLPNDLAGSYSVILIYRGHWCPFCNEQMAAFSAADEAFSQASIKVAAFSVDDEATTEAFVAKNNIHFKVGYLAKIEEIVSATGAYRNEAPMRGHFLENTGFVLGPDGMVVNAVYSSRAIGRLVPSDVLRLVAFMKGRP